MKVLFDLSFVRNHIFMGISKYAYRILDYISKNKKEDEFVLLFNKTSAQTLHAMFPMFNYAEIGNKKIEALPKLGTIYLSHQFQNFVNTSDFDAVFCPWGSTITSRKVKSKMITVIHDFQFRKDTSGLSNLMRARVDDQIVKNADKIVTISEFSKQEILDFYPEVLDKLVSLSNVVSVGQSFSDRYVLPKYLLYVGRICKMKNTATLVKAFSLIADKIPHSLVIVGGKSKYWEKDVMPVIKQNNLEKRITLLQGISEAELNGLYKKADLFVFPSMREGFGFPPIEAAMLGTPVLSSRCDSLPEVTMDLLNYFNNPLDEHELADEIIRVLKKGRNSTELMKIAKIYEDAYSVDVVSKRIYDYIAENASH